MVTKETSRPVLQDGTGKIGAIGEDHGGIPIIAGLTFLMLAVVLVALGYLFFNAPSAGFKAVDRHDYVNRPIDYNQGQKPGVTPLPPQEAPR